MTVREEAIRDLQQAATRLTAVPPVVRVFVTEDGQRVAALVLAEAAPQLSEDAAVASLLGLVTAMLNSNIDHDRVFEDRLAAYQKQLAASE